MTLTATTISHRSILSRLPEDRMPIDPTKSLNEISGLSDDPGPYESGLEGRHREALATPLRDLDGYQIAMLIGQETQLEILARYFMDRLHLDSLARIEDEHCFALVFDRIGPDFWRKQPALNTEALALICDCERQLPDWMLDIAVSFVANTAGDGGSTLSFRDESIDPDGPK